MLRTVLFIVLTAFSATALAELAGTWTIVSEGRRGKQESTLVIVAKGEAHSGTLTGPRGRAMEIETIEVTGSNFTFESEISTRMGDFTLTYSGSLDGDAIEGSIETPMGDVPFTGKRKTEAE